MTTLPRPIKVQIAAMGPSTYDITFRGRAGPTMRAAFDGLQIVIDDGYTTLRACVSDQAALYGVLERIRTLGLELVDVTLMPADPAEGG
jgi:hypothetical protein